MSAAPADRLRAGRVAAVLGAVACLGGTALVCVGATVIVAGSTSRYGATAAGQAMLWLFAGELLIALLALLAYARTLIRRRLRWWGLWWGAVALLMGLGLALLGALTLVLFNR
jgi:hypothetical protein